jgi:hypothetical protein
MSTPGGDENVHDKPSSTPPGGRQRGPRYDAASRQLAQDAPESVLTWLKVPVHGAVVPLPTEFTANSRQLDLLAAVGPNNLVHVEFETSPTPDVAVRILDYRAQVMKQYPGKRLRQVLVVLATGPVASCDDPENGFYLGLNTVYLRDRDPAEFLADPALAPFTVLAAGDRESRRRSLAAALQLIQERGGERARDLLQAAETLATIRLDPRSIDQAQKETDMTVESIANIYGQTEVGQELIRRGEARGRVTGEARARGALAALLRLKFGDDPAIADIVEQLVSWPDADAAVQAITSAATIDDVGVIRQPRSRGHAAN